MVQQVLTKNHYISNQVFTYLKKNADYGNSFYKSLDKYGDKAFYVRVEDKLNRLSKLITSSREVADESITDTIDDTFNYTAMFITYKEIESNMSMITAVEVITVMESLLHDNYIVEFLCRNGLLKANSNVAVYIKNYYKNKFLYEVI